MSWLITAVVVTGAVTATAQIRAGQAQEIELEKAAEEEKITAESRELARRQQLNKILASNVVGQAVSGIAGEGTPESLALASARQASISEGLEGLSSRLKQAQLRRRAATARTTGRLQAASTLLSTTTSALQLGQDDG